MSQTTVLGRCIQHVANYFSGSFGSFAAYSFQKERLLHTCIHDVARPPHISSGQYTSLRAVANISLYPSLGYVPVFLSFSVFLRKLHLQDPRIKFMKTSSLKCRRIRWALKSSLNWSFLASFSVLSNITSFTQTRQDPKIKSIKRSSMRCVCVCLLSFFLNQHHNLQLSVKSSLNSLFFLLFLS